MRLLKSTVETGGYWQAAFALAPLVLGAAAGVLWWLFW